MKNTKLAPHHLRKIAKIYFDTPEKILPYFGICFNIEATFGEQDSDYCWYRQMECLMQELYYSQSGMFKTESGEYQVGTIKRWESRAYMCLFLAEYLETK